MTLGLPVEYGVVEDRFHLGLGAGVEGFLDGPPTTLAENQQYQRVMATLPTEHNALMYLDLKQVIPLVQLLVAAAEGVEAIGSGFQASTDASPECGEYGTQEEAQEAYDEDAFEHFLLDQDGDGRACEDYFAPATPGAGRRNRIWRPAITQRSRPSRPYPTSAMTLSARTGSSTSRNSAGEGRWRVGEEEVGTGRADWSAPSDRPGPVPSPRASACASGSSFALRAAVAYSITLSSPRRRW